MVPRGDHYRTCFTVELLWPSQPVHLQIFAHLHHIHLPLTLSLIKFSGFCSNVNQKYSSSRFSFPSIFIVYLTCTLLVLGMYVCMYVCMCVCVCMYRLHTEVTYLYYDPNLNCSYEKMQVNK